jgi:hypothetical protein
LVAVVLLSIVAFRLPHAKPKAEDLKKSAAIRDVVAKRFIDWMPEDGVRVEQHAGLNLDVWVSRRAFESTVYPDRKNLLNSIGVEWCAQPGRWTLDNFMAAITVRDLRDGKNLAAHHCLFSRTDLDPN